MRFPPIIGLLLLALGLLSALPLHLAQPSATIEEGAQVSFGDVGPGQTFVVQIDPIAMRDGQFAGQWDRASATGLPEGWVSKPAKLYQKPLQVEIVVPPDASDGDYVSTITVEDENGRENIGNTFVFSVLVHVRHDVLAMVVDPHSQETGAGQPARFTITLTNTGSANDVFDVTSSGVKGWAFRKSVYLAAGASKTITYEVVGSDESDYRVTLSARSTSSPLIRQEQPVGLTVRTNLLSDYKATSHGVMLFPILQAPIYGLAGLLALLFP